MTSTRIDILDLSNQIDALWLLLAEDCPRSAIRWAAVGWSIGRLEGDRERARQFEADGREMLELARPYLRQPTFQELERRRRGAA